MHIRSEKHTFPRRTAFNSARRCYSWIGRPRKVEKASGMRDLLDHDLNSRAGMCIAHQPLGNRETVMGPLDTREDG